MARASPPRGSTETSQVGRPDRRPCGGRRILRKEDDRRNNRGLDSRSARCDRAQGGRHEQLSEVPHMIRRATVAVGAIAILGVAARPRPAPPRRTRSASSAARSSRPASTSRTTCASTPANAVVKSGATVTVVNKGTDPAPHTISFVEKAFCRRASSSPRSARSWRPTRSTEEEEAVGVFKVDDGAAVPDQDAAAAGRLARRRQAGGRLAVHRSRPEEASSSR